MALNTSLHLPSIITAEDSLPEDLLPGERAAPGPLHGPFCARARYEFTPNTSLVGTLTQFFFEHLLEEGLVLEEKRNAFFGLAPSERLQMCLEAKMEALAPNLFLKVSGIDDEYTLDHSHGFQQRGRFGNSAEEKDLVSLPALTCWVSCEVPWQFYLSGFRSRVEKQVGDEAAYWAVEAVLDGLSPLMPSWGQARAMEWVREMHWMGYSDDREQIAQMRYMLSQERDCDPEEVPVEDARERAGEYSWTSDYVREVLDDRYRDFSSVSEKEKTKACGMLAHAGLAEERRIVEAARDLEAQNQDLVDEWGYRFGPGMGYYAQAIGLVALSGETNSENVHLVLETFEEHARREAENGYEVGAVAGLLFDPLRAQGRRRFFSFLDDLAAAAGASRALIEAVNEHTFDTEKTHRSARALLRSIPEEKEPPNMEIPGCFKTGYDAVRPETLKAGNALAVLSSSSEATRPFPSSSMPLLA